METHELVKLVRHHWARVNIGGPKEAEEASEAFKDAGIKAKVHVGKRPEDFTRRQIVEWYAGNLVSMVDENELFGMNAWCNTVDTFAKEEWQEEEAWT